MPDLDRIEELEREIVMAPFIMPIEMETRVRALLQPVVDMSKGTTTLDGIFGDFHVGDCQIWVVKSADGVSGTFVTRILVYPSGRRVLSVDNAGGVIRDLDIAFDHVEMMAREVNADAIRVKGRKGWQKVLPGFKEVSRTLEREL